MPGWGWSPLRGGLCALAVGSRGCWGFLGWACWALGLVGFLGLWASLVSRGRYWCAPLVAGTRDLLYVSVLGSWVSLVGFGFVLYLTQVQATYYLPRAGP